MQIQVVDGNFFNMLIELTKHATKRRIEWHNFTSKQKDRQVIFIFTTELELADLSEEFKERLNKSVFEGK